MQPEDASKPWSSPPAPLLSRPGCSIILKLPIPACAIGIALVAPVYFT